MKKALLLLLLSSILLSLQAQEPLPLESQEFGKHLLEKAYFPKMKGKLLNYSPLTDSQLVMTFVTNGFGIYSQEEYIIDIQADGSFTLPFEYAYNYQEVFLIIENYFGVFYAHEDLEMALDLTRLREKRKYIGPEALQFSGTDSTHSMMLYHYYKYKATLPSRLDNRIQKLLIMSYLNKKGDPKKRVKKCRALFEGKKELNDAFFNKYPSEYEWVIENDRLSEFYSNVFLYHIHHDIDPQLLQEALEHKPLVVSNSSYSYYSYLEYMLGPYGKKESALVNQEVLAKKVDETEQGQAIQRFLAEYEKKTNKKSFDRSEYKKGKKFLGTFEKEFEAAKRQRYLEELTKLPQEKADVLRLFGQPSDLYEREKYFSKVIPHVKLDWVKGVMQKSLETERRQIEEIEKNLKKSLPLAENHSLGENLLNPDEHTQLFVSKEADIDGVMASILNSYPEKSIIFDIWAPWCGPCISDMKKSGPIKKELKELPVEMIYLCVEDGTNQEKWKKKVLELGLSGTHIFLNKKLSRQLMDKYKFSGYPSYLFIDKERNIDKHFIQGISRIRISELKERL